METSHLYYLKEKGLTWFNPSYGLNGFWDEYRKLSKKLNKPHKYVWNHRDLKKSKRNICNFNYCESNGKTRKNRTVVDS